jgi:hypothetical protein
VDTLLLADAQRRRRDEPGPEVETIDRRVLSGFADFLLYALLVYPLAMAHRELFFLWICTIPFVFLATVMPVGPISSFYWGRQQLHTALPSSDDPNADLEHRLLARRQRLQELYNDTVHVEAELQQDMPNAGDLKFAFEAQIRQAQETRSRIQKEMERLDVQLTQIWSELGNVDNYLRSL